jgi:hypothetical protein
MATAIVACVNLFLSISNNENVICYKKHSRIQCQTIVLILTANVRLIPQINKKTAKNLHIFFLYPSGVLVALPQHNIHNNAVSLFHTPYLCTWKPSAGDDLSTMSHYKQRKEK